MVVVHVDNNHCWAYVAIDSPTGRNITPKPKGNLKNLLSKYSNIKQSSKKISNTDIPSSEDGGDRKRAKKDEDITAEPIQPTKE